MTKQFYMKRFRKDGVVIEYNTVVKMNVQDTLSLNTVS